MTTLKQLKPALNFIKKEHRPVLKLVNVTSEGMRLTNLETYIIVNDSFGIEPGFYEVPELGIVNNSKQCDEFPQFPELDQVKMSVELTQGELEAFIPFCSKDETRLMLNGMALNKGHLVATDGHRMHFKNLNIDSDHDSYIFPRESLVILNKLLKKYKVNEFTVNYSDDFSQVKTDYFTFYARLIQREFPKWDYCVPKKFTGVFTINEWPSFKEIKPLLKRSYASRIELKNKKVSIHFLTESGEELTHIIGESSKYIEFTVGFNALYLDQLFKKHSELTFKFNSELSPVGFMADGYEGVIMPLRL